LSIYLFLRIFYVRHKEINQLNASGGGGGVSLKTGAMNAIKYLCQTLAYFSLALVALFLAF